MKGPLNKAKTEISRVLIASLFSCQLTSSVAQTSVVSKTPLEVVKAFRKMDSAGERLTSSGWYKASQFFVKSARPTKQLFIYVIAEHEGMYVNTWHKVLNQQRVDVDFGAVGQIDSSGRFTSVVAPSLIDVLGLPVKKLDPPFMYGPIRCFDQYIVVLTDTHWEFGPNGEGPREAKGAPEWRIEHFPYQPRVTVNTAIRYLVKLRDESSNATIKRNAANSIATLRSLGGKPSGQKTK